jgi:hypothetical protein
MKAMLLEKISDLQTDLHPLALHDLPIPSPRLKNIA